MSLATGDAILILDADEVISKGHEFIREAIEVPDFICAQVSVLNTVRQGPVGGERVQQMRVFKNDPEIRWQYSVHNQIEDSVRAYGKKFFRMNGRPGGLVVANAEIVHTGYDLTPEEAIEKYTPRLGLLRSEITDCKKNGLYQEAAYYQFQLALMLHTVYSTEEALDLWNDLEYGKLNDSNRWYAHYTAARSFLHVGNLDQATHHCNGMYEAQASGYIAIEPATDMIAGVVLLEGGEMEKGLRLLIQAYLDNLAQRFGVRCVLDEQKLIRDIAKCYGGEVESYLLNETNNARLTKYLRGLQSVMVDIPREVEEVIS